MNGGPSIFRGLLKWSQSKQTRSVKYSNVEVPCDLPQLRVCLWRSHSSSYASIRHLILVCTPKSWLETTDTLLLKYAADFGFEKQLSLSRVISSLSWRAACSWEREHRSQELVFSLHVSGELDIQRMWCRLRKVCITKTWTAWYWPWVRRILYVITVSWKCSHDKTIVGSWYKQLQEICFQHRNKNIMYVFNHPRFEECSLKRVFLS